MATLQMVSTSEIHRHPHNPRRPVTEAKSLVTSVKQHGILSPLTVTPDPEGGYRLIAGERRHFAATANKLDEVPAYVRDFTEQEAATALAVDNFEREDLTAAEEAQGYLNMESVGLDAKAIAREVNRPVKHVTAHMKVGHLAASAIEALHHQQVTLEQALALGEIEDVPEIHTAAIEAIESGRNAMQAIRDAQDAHQAHHGWNRVRAIGEAAGITVLDHLPAYGGPEEDARHMPGGIDGHTDLPCLALAYSRWSGGEVA